MLNIHTLTLAGLRDLIASGDDTHDNQLRVRENGEVFLSQDVGADNLAGIAYRFETFDAGNDYVGPNAAADSVHIERLYRALKAYSDNHSSYVDRW